MSLAVAQQSESSSWDLKNTTSLHTAACAAVSFLHVDLATNELVCWQALDDGWPCELDPALWALQVAICSVFHNPLVESLDQTALACLSVLVQKCETLRAVDLHSLLRAGPARFCADPR